MEEFFVAIESHRVTAFCLMVWVWLVASALSPVIKQYFQVKKDGKDDE